MKVSQKQPRGRFARSCGAASFARSPSGDIDFADGYLRVRSGAGKAAREDVIPLHEQVLEALTEAKSADAKPTDHVFRTMPTIRTFYFLPGTGTHGHDAIGERGAPIAVDSTGAESCTSKRVCPVTTSHRPNAAVPKSINVQPVGNAQCCTIKHDDSSKRANGLEPSTFSLEG